MKQTRSRHPSPKSLYNGPGFRGECPYLCTVRPWFDNTPTDRFCTSDWQNALILTWKIRMMSQIRHPSRRGDASDRGGLHNIECRASLNPIKKSTKCRQCECGQKVVKDSSSCQPATTKVLRDRNSFCCKHLDITHTVLSLWR
jgi:hypothetical protein